MDKEVYTYETSGYHDELYNVRVSMDRLTTLLQGSKHVKREDRELLLEALEIIEKLEK